MEFVEMGNWEQVRTFAALHKFLETFFFTSSVQHWESSNGW
jgi:hypothetical protein